MTDVTVPPAEAAAENVQRGALFTLIAIPIGIAAFALVAGLFGFITGIIAIVIPYAAAWLYQKGAGAPLTRKGWGPWIAITAVAVIVGTFSGVIAGAYNLYQSVGGSGLTPAFWTTVGNQFTRNGVDTLFALVIGIGLGLVGIVSVLRGGRRSGAANPNRLTPAQTDAIAPDAPAAATTAPPVAPPAAAAPPAAPLNQPSPGVMLNGKPVDPDQK